MPVLALGLQPQLFSSAGLTEDSLSIFQLLNTLHPVQNIQRLNQTKERTKQPDYLALDTYPALEYVPGWLLCKIIMAAKSRRTKTTRFSYP